MPSTYEVITDRIIAQLEAGCPPWRKPWAAEGAPKSLGTMKEYRGINALLLSCSRFASPYWITFNQAKEYGAHVKKGEKGWPVVFWKKFDGQKDDGETSSKERDHFMARYYTVFNVDQTEGLSEKLLALTRHAPRNPGDTIPACEAIVAGYAGGPSIEHGHARACYSPASDAVRMPAVTDFDSIPEYYSTLFHELGHSTGHGSRLARVGIEQAVHFGSANYSREELIAEMSAAFLAGKAGIETATLENSAAYCQSWIKVLKGDSKLVMVAAGQAQKAADLILGTVRS